MSIILRFLLLAILVAGALPAPVLAIEADHADDICAPDADPCVIREVVDVAPRAVLDFGLRAVELVDRGKLDFGAEGGTVDCGPFRVDVRGTAIDMRGRKDGITDSGNVTITARRSCSAAPGDYACVADGGCDLGTCSTRLCTNNPARTCSSDASCQVGFCTGLGRCTGFPSQRCSANADCDLGPCAAQTYCTRAPEGRRECSIDSDCSLGSCSVGSASIDLGGAVAGSSPQPARLVLDAADSVTISDKVRLSGRRRISDGGSLQVFSGIGDIVILDQIISRGGGGSTGGDVTLDAGNDVRVAARMNLNGGDFDGGIVDIRSVGDVHIEASILASSLDGSGYGGEIVVESLGDVFVGPPSGGRPVRLLANGHSSALGGAGDGGIIELSAEGNVAVDEHVQASVLGSMPDGYGGDFKIGADGDISFHGVVDASSGTREQAGGFVFFDSIGDVVLGPASTIDVSGGGGGAGDVEVSANGNASLEGTILALAGEQHGGGGMFVRSRGIVAVPGSIVIGGNSRAEIDIRGCRLSLPPTGLLLNTGAAGESTLTAYESMHLEAGSEMSTEDGTNELVYRTSDKPPILEGTISPAPTLTLDGALFGCPVCGNLEIDQTETCDDGNVTDGDGCSSACQTE